MFCHAGVINYNYCLRNFCVKLQCFGYVCHLNLLVALLLHSNITIGIRHASRSALNNIKIKAEVVH